MYEVLLAVFLIIAIALLVLIMLQQGKDTIMGSSFRGGASNTLFGSNGSTSFMTRTIAVLAMLFFVISLMIDDINSNKVRGKNEWKNLSSSKKIDLIQPNASAKLIENSSQKMH